MPDQQDAILTISNAIAVAEGYGVPNAAPTVNNNPGDIKPTPSSASNFTTDSRGVIIFPSADAGWAALQHQVGLITTGGSNTLYNPSMTWSEVGAHYANSDPNWANNVSKTLGVTPDTTVADTVAQIQGGQLPVNSTQPNPAVSGSNTAIQDPLSRPDASVQPLDNQDISNAQYSALAPDVVILQGLNEQPWFEDQGLVVGNRPARSKITPVAFNVILNDNRGPFLLSTEGRSGIPIELQLEASLKNFNIAMKHIYFKTTSRTGFHLTLWGMQADLITGQGTTGVMMNQLGITDFMSVSGVTQDLIDLVTSGFQHTSNTDVSQPTFDAAGNVLDTSPSVFTQTVQNQTNQLPSSFRVAAQDAFVEFVLLFKNNATVWFYNQNYNSSLVGNNQTGPSAWSPVVGASTAQANARNNDVMTRGSVVMKLEGSNYQGYFKTLAWVQDANNPFQWTFNFVFQVERTSTLLYYPR
jgi:hypothetical protein